MKSSEFIPANFVVNIRKDRSFFGGGVIIIHKADLVIQETEIIVPKPNSSNYTNSFHDEIVWAKLKSLAHGNLLRITDIVLTIMLIAYSRKV